MDRIPRGIRLDRETPADIGVPREWMLRLEAFRHEYWLLHDSARAFLAFAVHCALLAAGFKAEWTFAQLAPVLSALVVVWTMPHWAELRVMAADLRWVAFRWACAAVDFFGLLYVASTIHAPTTMSLGSMPLFGASEVRVPWLAGLWCWKLLVFDAPVAVMLVVALNVDMLRVNMWDGTCAGTMSVIVLSLIFLPLAIVIEVPMLLLPMCFFHTQILNFIGHSPRDITHTFPFLRVVPAADVEERSRRLNHLVRCAAVDALYDHCGFADAPWRRSTAAFADDRVRHMIERGVSVDEAVMVPEAKHDAQQSPVTWADQRVRPGRFFAPVHALLARPDGGADRGQRDGFGWRLDSWSLVGRVLALTRQGSHVAFPRPATFWEGLRAPVPGIHGQSRAVTWSTLVAVLWMHVRTLCIPAYAVAAIAAGALPHHDVLQGVCLALIVITIAVVVVFARDAVDCDTIAAVGRRLDCSAGAIAAYSDVTPGEALAAHVFGTPSASPARQPPADAGATMTLPLAVVQDVGAFLRRDDVSVHAALPTPRARRDARDAARAAGYARDDAESGLTVSHLASPATVRNLPNPNVFGWIECFDRAADRGCESDLWPLVVDAEGANGTTLSNVDRTFSSGDSWLKDTVAEWNERVDMRLALAGLGAEEDGGDSGVAAASNGRGDDADVDDDGSLMEPLLEPSAPHEGRASISVSPAAVEMGALPGSDPGATGGIGPVADYTPRMLRVLLRRIAQLVPSATAESQRRFLHEYQKAWEWQVIAALQYRVAGKVAPEPRVRPLHGFDDA